jgi:hypothetical protein
MFLVRVAKQEIRTHMHDLIALIKDHWHTQYFHQVVVLVNELAKTLGDEFSVYLPEVVPLLVSVLHSDARGSGSDNKAGDHRPLAGSSGSAGSIEQGSGSSQSYRKSFFYYIT